MCRARRPKGEVPSRSRLLAAHGSLCCGTISSAQGSPSCPSQPICRLRTCGRTAAPGRCFGRTQTGTSKPNGSTAKSRSSQRSCASPPPSSLQTSMYRAFWRGPRPTCRPRSIPARMPKRRWSPPRPSSPPLPPLLTPCTSHAGYGDPEPRPGVGSCHPPVHAGAAQPAALRPGRSGVCRTE